MSESAVLQHVLLRAQNQVDPLRWPWVGGRWRQGAPHVVRPRFRAAR